MQRLGFAHVIIVPVQAHLGAALETFLGRVEEAAGGVTLTEGNGRWQGVHEPILRIEARGREFDMEQRYKIEKLYREFTLQLFQLGEKSVYREQNGVTWLQGPNDHLPRNVPGGGGLSW